MSSDLSTPRIGIHAMRIPILDIAAVDTIGTLAGSYGLSKWMGWSFTLTTGGLFAASLYFHHLYNVDTTVHRKFMELIGNSNLDAAPEQKSGKCPMSYLWK